MERLSRVAVALLLLSFNFRLGICSYDAQQGTVKREEDVHSAARAIQAKHIRKVLQQPSRYRSRQHFGSKAGWPNLGVYPPPAYTGGNFQGSSFPPPASSLFSPNQQLPFPQWPPWPWAPNLPPGIPSSAPAPSPVVPKPLPLPRQAQKPAHSIALPPRPAPVVTDAIASPSVTGAAPEARHAGATMPIYVIAAAGASFLVAMSMALFVLCYRSSKVVTVRPWATGLSGQLQKAFVIG